MNHYTESRTIKRDCVSYHKGGCVSLDKTYCAKRDMQVLQNRKEPCRADREDTEANTRL